MSGYDALIEKLKKKLEGFGSIESEIAQRYEAAKDERKKEYELERAELIKSRDSAISDAATRKLKSEKDIAQIHESRGLTRSGEAIGEALNRELIEANSIRDAQKELYEGTKARWDRYDNDIRSLDESEKEEKRSEKEKLEDQIFELEKANVKDGGSSTTSSGATDGDDGDIGDYEPSISESVLATRLFNMFKNSDGKLTAGGSRELELYLEKLREDNGLSDEYMKNLIFALKSYGYDNANTDEDEGLDGSFDSLERAANNSSAKVEDMMYQFYRGRGATESEAMTAAKKHAIWAKLDVIYRNSVSRDQFIYYARKMGSSMSTIYRYFDRVEDINKYNIDGGLYLKDK